MSNLKDRLIHRKKQLNCPGCKALLRVPIRSGKRMLVTCPHCLEQFELRFSNPLKETFQWDKSMSFKRNVENLINRFSAQPLKNRILLLAIIFSATFFIVSLFRLLTIPVAKKANRIEKSEPSKQSESYEEKLIDKKERMEL